MDRSDKNLIIGSIKTLVAAITDPGWTDEDRLKIVSILSEKICIHCGGTRFPCYCRRDD